MKKVFKIVGLIVAVIVVGVIVIVALGPPAGVVTQTDMPVGLVEDLIEKGIIAEREDIIYFSTGDLFSGLKLGCLFTGREVIAYDNAEDENTIERAAYHAIAEIEFVEVGPGFGQNQVTVIRNDQTRFNLLVPSGGGDGVKFYNRLVKEWRKRSYED